MSRFGKLDKRAVEPVTRAEEPQEAAPIQAAPTPLAERQPAARAKAREGKKPVIGYFSTDLSRELRTLSAIEGKTMQALLGEAIDMLMTDRGRNRFNER